MSTSFWDGLDEIRFLDKRITAVDKAIRDEVEQTKTQIDALTLKVNRALSLAIAALGTLTFFITIGCLIFLFYLMRG